MKESWLLVAIFSTSLAVVVGRVGFFLLTNGNGRRCVRQAADLPDVLYWGRLVEEG